MADKAKEPPKKEETRRSACVSCGNPLPCNCNDPFETPQRRR